MFCSAGEAHCNSEFILNMQADAFICIERELVSNHIEEENSGRYVQTVSVVTALKA